MSKQAERAEANAAERTGAEAAAAQTAPAAGTAQTATAGSRQDQVQGHYAEVAADVLHSLQPDAVCGRSSCCESPARAGEAAQLYGQDKLAQLPEGALAASRGCGDPVAQANLQPGEDVLDLGSGGGIDALIASQLVGPAGTVYGVDMTEEMVRLARKNAQDAGAGNVEFLHGRIEELPLPDASVDAVISNCVINFSSNKQAVMREACRVLRPGGRFVVSDIVLFAACEEDALPPLCRITGCTCGMQDAEAYRTLLQAAGFAEAAIAPKTVYTFSVLREKAQRKGRMDSYKPLAEHPSANGACGSAIITAYKTR